MRHEHPKSCKKVAKSCKIYYCDDCDYSTSRKSSWNKHIVTIKHLNNASPSVTKSVTKFSKSCKIYSCENCGCEYNSRNGLWYHKKKCEYKKITEEGEEEEEEDKKPANNDKVLVDKELLMGMVELLKNGTNNTNNTNCNNTYNNNITVQVYLDDHCKDAKTVENLIGRLAKEVKYKLEDVVYKSNLQYIKDAPSELFIKEMNKMPAEERPIHCADGKRGKFWVNKEKEGWVQEDVKEGGKLNKEIFMFKHKLYQDVNYDIMHTDEDCDKLGNVKLKLHREIIEKSTVDNAIIAKLATNCNIKDAIKDIENKQ